MPRPLQPWLRAPTSQNPACHPGGLCLLKHCRQAVIPSNSNIQTPPDPRTSSLISDIRPSPSSAAGLHPEPCPQAQRHLQPVVSHLRHAAAAAPGRPLGQPVQQGRAQAQPLKKPSQQAGHPAAAPRQSPTRHPAAPPHHHALRAAPARATACSALHPTSRLASTTKPPTTSAQATNHPAPPPHTAQQSSRQPTPRAQQAR